MNTHESYVSLETAKLLKQLGFNWKCRRVYCNWGSFTNDGCIEDSENGLYNWNGSGIAEQYSAPTLEVSQRWLREEKDFDINILTDFDSVKRLYYVRYVVKDGYYKTSYITNNNQSYVYFSTYEEALEEGIKRALEIILEKGK